MRIAIDGFNLGLKQGTGLATYARELSHVMSDAGHEVCPIYGLSHVRKEDTLAWPSFIQSLLNSGEVARTDYKRWLGFAIRYIPHMLFPTSGVRLNAIPVNDIVDIDSVRGRLPSFHKIYNCPGIFRSAQLYSMKASHPLRIRMPKEGIDAFHLTCPLPIKMSGAKTILTAHDIIPLTLPHSTLMNLKHYRQLLNITFNNADMIFCISEQTKKDIQEWFGIPDSRLHLTYQAVNIPSVYRNLSQDAVALFLRESFDLPFKGYFLYFGSVEPKKNVARVIDAMRTANTKLPLVIAGKDGWLFDDVHQRLAQEKTHSLNRNPKKIRRIEYLPFEHLMHLIRGAKAVIFPSLYEGFGLPVLEAMQLGCPVITSNTTSLKEVAGDAALTVNPNSVQEIKQAIERLDKDDNLCQELIQRGYKQASFFSPENHAKRLAEGYEKAGLKWDSSL